MSSHHDFPSIMRGFHDWCRSRRRDWKFKADEHWFTCRGAYHSFVHQETLDASSFRELVDDYRIYLRKEALVSTILSFIALLFTDKPPLNLHIVLGDPELLSRVAFYDLSEACRGRHLCVTINRTDSAVFQEFEVFLEKIYGLIHESLERYYDLKQMEQRRYPTPPSRHRPLDEPA